MSKYIPIEPEHLEDWVDIMLEMLVGVNPYIDEDDSRMKMENSLRVNKLTKSYALQLGAAIKDTEIWYGRKDV